jgi:predicted ATP-dependent serine protease
MYYCTDCDIAYEDLRGNCPLCEAKKEIKSLEEEIERLNNLE